MFSSLIRFRKQERFCYICPDIAKEFAKYEASPSKWIKLYEGLNSVTREKFNVDVGHERFLGPEIFFHPEVSDNIRIGDMYRAACFTNLVIVATTKVSKFTKTIVAITNLKN